MKGELFIVVLGLSGTDFCFVLIACMVLCFGFVTKTVLINMPVFWLLLNSACAALRLSLFPTLSASPASSLGVCKKMGGDATRITDPN